MEQKANRNGFLLNKFLLILLVFGAIGTSVLFINKFYTKTGVVEYNPSKHRQFILNFFKPETDRYWLVQSKDFSEEYMLDNRASSKRPENLGDLTVKVYVDENNNPTGFTAYHMKKFYRGHILFLAVDKQYRGKGYAKKLMKSAIDDLKSRGSTVVTILTRVSNKPARSLYTGLGFKETWSDDEFVRLEKVLD